MYWNFNRLRILFWEVYIRFLKTQEAKMNTLLATFGAYNSENKYENNTSRESEYEVLSSNV